MEGFTSLPPHFMLHDQLSEAHHRRLPVLYPCMSSRCSHEPEANWILVAHRSSKSYGKTRSFSSCERHFRVIQVFFPLSDCYEDTQSWLSFGHREDYNVKRPELNFAVNGVVKVVLKEYPIIRTTNNSAWCSSRKYVRRTQKKPK